MHERFAPCTVEAPFTQTRRTAWRRKQRASRRRSRRRKSRRPRRPPPRSQAPRRSRSKRDPLRRTRADMASTASSSRCQEAGGVSSPPAAAPAQVDDGGRRRSRGSHFTELAAGSDLKVGLTLSRNACRSQTSMCHCVKASKSGRVAREELVRAGPLPRRWQKCHSASRRPSSNISPTPSVGSQPQHSVLRRTRSLRRGIHRASHARNCGM